MIKAVKASFQAKIVEDYLSEKVMLPMGWNPQIPPPLDYVCRVLNWLDPMNTLEIFKPNVKRAELIDDLDPRFGHFMGNYVTLAKKTKLRPKDVLEFKKELIKIREIAFRESLFDLEETKNRVPFLLAKAEECRDKLKAAEVDLQNSKKQYELKQNKKLNCLIIVKKIQ